MKLPNVIVSEKSHKSRIAYDIVYSNLSLVNLLRDEGAFEVASEESLMSYWVDYYLAECNNGGLAQFVHNSRWNARVVDYVRAGLRAMSPRHFVVFERLEARMASLGAARLATYLGTDFFDDANKDVRALLNDADVFTANREDDLVEANARWLRARPKLEVLTIDAMFKRVEKVVGRTVERS